jgi:hypothetical protein
MSINPTTPTVAGVKRSRAMTDGVDDHYTTANRGSVQPPQSAQLELDEGLIAVYVCQLAEDGSTNPLKVLQVHPSFRSISAADYWRTARFFECCSSIHQAGFHCSC